MQTRKGGDSTQYGPIIDGYLRDNFWNNYQLKDIDSVLDFYIMIVCQGLPGAPGFPKTLS